jgi:hypothetical protein
MRRVRRLLRRWVSGQGKANDLPPTGAPGRGRTNGYAPYLPGPSLSPKESRSRKWSGAPGLGWGLAPPPLRTSPRAMGYQAEPEFHGSDIRRLRQRRRSRPWRPTISAADMFRRTVGFGLTACMFLAGGCRDSSGEREIVVGQETTPSPSTTALAEPSVAPPPPNPSPSPSISPSPLPTAAPSPTPSPKPSLRAFRLSPTSEPERDEDRGERRRLPGP